MNELVELVQEWAIERNLQTADPTKQYLKVVEEVGEIASGLARNKLSEVEDGIGDTIVTLIILAMQLDLKVDECLLTAYNEIKDRKGKMIDGVFVKESDLTNVK